MHYFGGHKPVPLWFCAYYMCMKCHFPLGALLLSSVIFISASLLCSWTKDEEEVELEDPLVHLPISTSTPLRVDGNMLTDWEGF